MPGCCCLNDTGNKILFKINISPPHTTIVALDGANLLAWHSRSPDLTPIDFFLWSHIKVLIYTSPVDAEEDFIARTVEAAATIRQQPGIFER